MLQPNKIYERRINEVIDYINEHLNQSFKLDELAAIARFSPFYFHRIFVAVIGETINAYTSRIRAEKSARLLKFSRKSLSDIAYDCGFSSPATFSRSFKKYFEISPSAYRKSGNIEKSKICKELHPMQAYLHPMSIEEKKVLFPIVIKEFEKRKVAYIRVRDSFKDGTVINAFKKLISWTKEVALYDESQFFGMSIDDPMVTPQDKYRYEACVTVPFDCVINDQDDIQMMELPKCTYATVLVSGDIKQVATAISYMYNDWLINSEYEPEHQYGLELFLDREKVCSWNYFNLELCIPIKSLNRYFD